MPHAQSYTRAFHQRFKNSADPRVESSYNSLIFLLSHAKSDSLAAKWLGVSSSTIRRWKSTGFSSKQADTHFSTIERVRSKIERRLDREIRRAGPDAEVEIRPVAIRRPGPTPSGFPGALHIFIEGGKHEQIWAYFLWAQSQHYPNGEPVYEAFYFTVRFGFEYDGMYWDADEGFSKRQTKATYIPLDGGSTYNTTLARSCADLHPFDEPWIYFYPENQNGKWHSKPKKGGNNLTLYECFTKTFYQQHTTIERIVFIERKPTYYKVPGA